jgi:hypothetical protein
MKLGDISPAHVRHDLLPVRIFWHADQNTWVAINNRGYATYCIAGIQPTRLLPRIPTQDELNRLTEESNMGGRFAARTLPSLEIPVTNGVNDLTLAYVVTVPTWT